MCTAVLKMCNRSSKTVALVHLISRLTASLYLPFLTPSISFLTTHTSGHGRTPNLPKVSFFRPASVLYPGITRFIVRLVLTMIRNR